MPDENTSELPAEFLITVTGKKLLDEVAQLPVVETQTVNALLRKGRYAELLPPDQTLLILAVSIVHARKKAQRRYPEANHLFLTESMLAQATSATIADYHAACLKPSGSVTDLCCGAGMDSIAFARAGMMVDAVELDAARLVFAQENARICGVEETIRFYKADAVEFPVTTAALFADPARRTDDGTRVSRHTEQYAPPLSVLLEKMASVTGGCLKLSPLLPDEFLLSLGGRVEFLSENRECKEACVWFGDVRGAAGDAPLAAVILPDRVVVVADDSSKIVRPVGKYLYEPDPAVIRAGAVTAAANIIGAGFISAEDVYLTGDEPLPESSPVRTYRVFASMPFQRKEVAAFVRKAGVGRVVVKKRRARMEPEAVLAEIKASNRGPEPEILLVLIREEKGHSVVFCTPEPSLVPAQAEAE